MRGNPCDKWSGYRDYIIAMLPKLGNLDGAEITRTDRLAALQKLPELKEV
jgi:protein TilB